MRCSAVDFDGRASGNVSEHFPVTKYRILSFILLLPDSLAARYPCRPLLRPQSSTPTLFLLSILRRQFDQITPVYCTVFQKIIHRL